MAGSFIENINLLAGKLGTIEESNSIFNEDVVPILREISELDIGAAIADLKKGNYLGNRKLDINLVLNMQDVDEELLERNPDLVETIWTDVNKAVHYDRAFITFVDGAEIELPFMFDGSPVTVTTHGDLLAQFARLDYVYAKAQIDSIYQVTVGNSTDYTVTIDATPYTFTSDIEATRENIIAGIANMLNSAVVPVTALVTDNGTKLNLTAKVPGNPFFASVSSNMAINTIQVNVIEGPVETAFLAKLSNTLAANFAEPVVGEIARLYDVIGFNSNVERIRLNAVSGSYKTQAPIYYWANTTSAFQTLSMRANDIIKLGTEIDNIILLAKRIEEVTEVQKRIPQLVDTFDVNNNPNGDETIYNNLSELVAVHSKLVEIITLYNDLKVGGTNYVKTVVQNLQGSNTIGVVATDLQLGVDSKIIHTGANINKITTVSDNIANINTVVPAIPNIDLVVDTVVPNISELLLVNDNALIAKNKALEATNAAAVATTKSNEIKNVSVGTTITGIPGTAANVTYNPLTSKFTFIIPKGDKGERGEPFNVNAVGLKLSQNLYDSRPTGFSFLAIDEGQIYFKLSSTLGDWSIGSPFGKGDTGDAGNDGISVLNTAFTSTTDASGLAGQSGAMDTYTITYSNLSTDTFTIRNGIDGLSTAIDIVENVVGVGAASHTVTIDTTSGIFEVYLNGLLLPTLNYTLTGSAVVVNTPVAVGDEITVKKIYAVEVLDTYSQSAIDMKMNNLETKVRTNMPGLGLELSNTLEPKIGQFAWNQNAQTFDFKLNNNVTLKGGQEIVKLVINDTVSTILKGTVVMNTGSIGINGNATVVPCTGLFNASHSVYGIATQDILAGEDGFITTDGFVTGVDTTGSLVGETWIGGDILYVKPNGGGNLTNVVPADTELKVSAAKVVKAQASGSLEVRITSVVNENAFVPRVVSTNHRLAKFDGTTGKIKDSNLVSDSTGNLGLNVTPSVWHTSIRSLETEAGSLFNYSGSKLSLVQNAYQGIDDMFRYKSDAPATMITQENGEFIISTAPSGVTEEGVAFTERMKVTNDGVLTVNGVTALTTSGGTMTGALTAIRETKVAMDANNIDLATGNLFTKTITVATTLTISNALADGNANSFILELTNGGSKIITWWAGMKWAGGTAPTLTAAGVDILGFYSHDGGTTWRGMVMAKDSK